jgi:hypothetical protein
MCAHNAFSRSARNGVPHRSVDKSRPSVTQKGARKEHSQFCLGMIVTQGTVCLSDEDLAFDCNTFFI